MNTDPITVLLAEPSVQALHVACDWVREGHGVGHWAAVLALLGPHMLPIGQLHERQALIAWRLCVEKTEAAAVRGGLPGMVELIVVAASAAATE